MNGILDDFKNAWNKPNNGLAQIIMINIIVFLVLSILEVILTVSGVNETVYLAVSSRFMMPANGSHFLLQPWTLVTYFFTHEKILHILFNMLFLYWFGRIIQEFLGQKKVIALYVLGGLSGGLFYMLMYNLIPYYHDRIDGALMLGASAGVYAIVVGAATFMPNYTLFLFLFGPVKIKYIALFSLVLSFKQITGSNAGGELAHLGGAAMGFFYIIQLRKGHDYGAWVLSTMYWFKSFFVHTPKIKVTHRAEPSKKASKQTGRPVSKSDQDEIDAILDKISQSGYDSLSKDEKQKLFNASKK